MAAWRKVRPRDSSLGADPSVGKILQDWNACNSLDGESIQSLSRRSSQMRDALIDPQSQTRKRLVSGLGLLSFGESLTRSIMQV